VNVKKSLIIFIWVFEADGSEGAGVGVVLAYSKSLPLFKESLITLFLTFLRFSGFFS